MQDAHIIIGWRSALIFAVCLPILISAVILMFRQSERRANTFLALALILSVWSMGPQIIGFANAYSVWPGLTFFPFNAELLIPPLIYFHAQALMTKARLGWRKYLLIPGIITMGYYLIAFLFLGDYQDKWAFSRTVHAPFIEPITILTTLIMAMICLWLTVSLIWRYRTFLKETESAARDFDPIWLIWVFSLLGLAALVWLSLGLISLLNPDISYVAAYPFQLIVMTLFAALGFFAITRINEAFPKIGTDEKVPANPAPEKDWQQEGEILKHKVLTNSWHLEPRLSIRDVASRMGTNDTYISRALNLGIGQSFNRFINEMRVEHAKGMIKENKGNFLSIAMNSGFNSKATFNRVFRDIAGETPSAFKKRTS
ncbi:AraC family transcriptional regulator [Hellea sp.]|nr:AraC family transcriptional regulator [Hellea sp.]